MIGLDSPAVIEPPVRPEVGEGHEHPLALLAVEQVGAPVPAIASSKDFVFL